MADRIDPRLFAGQPIHPPPSSHAAPAYPAGPSLQNISVPAQQPYYVNAGTASSSPARSHPPVTPASTLDPALEGPSSVRPASSDDGIEEETEADYDGGHDSAKSPNDAKRPRACDSCRGLKVRCEPDPAHPEGSCKRCAKAKRSCIVTPPTKKRQRKADNRVAELERKIEALTNQIASTHSSPTDFRQLGGNMRPELAFAQYPQRQGTYKFGAVQHDWAPEYPTSREPVPLAYPAPQPAYRDPEAKRRKIITDGNGHSSTTIPEDMDEIHRDMTEMGRRHKNGVHSDHADIKDEIRRRMPFATAERIFNRYVNEICPHFPAVPLAPGTTAHDVLEKKPLLFLAILAASSHGSAEPLVNPEIQRDLVSLLKEQFANIIWKSGEKSLEIVQALHLGVLWYRPPLHYEQHNFYMMVNCAAVMALDLGLGKRTNRKLNTGQFHRPYLDTSSVECRRTFLVCYYLCMSITMVLRRPILLRWTKYMEESIHILEMSSEALPSDKLLCHHVKLARIGENISVQFSMDDPSVEISIADPDVKHAMKRFEEDFDHLVKGRDKAIDDATIQLGEHVTNLYIHEIALHNTQNFADFHPPFSNLGKEDNMLVVSDIAALNQCLTATHGILDTILEIPIDTLITLPVIFCVRSIYAIVCLMKMWVAVESTSVGNTTKNVDLQIEHYTNSLLKMFQDIVSRDAQSPHGKFFYVAKRLQEKFAHIKKGTNEGAAGPGTCKDEQQPPGNSSNPPHSSGSGSSGRTSDQSQTPLHLLSEVAMGNNNRAHPSLPQPQLMQHALPQQHDPSQQLMAAPWYGEPMLNSTGMMTIPGAGSNFFNLDFNIGTDADLNNLFIPDSVDFVTYQDPSFSNFNNGNGY